MAYVFHITGITNVASSGTRFVAGAPAGAVAFAGDAIGAGQNRIIALVGLYRISGIREGRFQSRNIRLSQFNKNILRQIS